MSQESQVSGIVDNVVNDIATNHSTLLDYFNGKNPNQPFNFLADNVALTRLHEKLTQFFYGGLGCSDQLNTTKYNYTINLGVHAGMNISFAEHAEFNKVVVRATGIPDKDDQDSIFMLLDSLRPDICSNEDCFTLCHNYTIAGANTTNDLVATIVDRVVGVAVADASPLKKYFDGSLNNGRPNYLNDSAALGTLRGHLIEFFGFALGCRDGTIGAYTGNLVTAHANMGITLADFNAFNNAVGDALKFFKVMNADADAVVAKLGTLQSQICTDDTDCNPNRATSTTGGGQSSNGGSTGGNQSSNGQSTGGNQSSNGQNSSGAKSSGAASSSNATPNVASSSSSDATTVFFSFIIAFIALLF